MSGIYLVTLLAMLCLSANGAAHSRVKRIISGVESDHSEAAFMVSMQGEIVTRRFFGIPISHRHVYCGGTLISDRWVLTAAHCFKDGADDPSDWHARMASPNLKRTLSEGFFHVLGKILNKQEWQQIEYHPVRIVKHPDYVNRGDWENDIALVKLRETVSHSSNDKVDIIPLLPSTDEIKGDTCIAYGWGCTALGSPSTSKVMKASLPLASNTTCSSIWNVNFRKKVCAGGTTGFSESACHGDSGGPLVCETKDGDRKQVGVISYIAASNPSNYPVVLTRVSAYLEWISNTIG